MGSYEGLGVRRVVNAWGPMTVIGSARVRPAVIEAMAAAAGAYVDVIGLQRAAGRRLAELIGVDACYVSAGSAAGLAVATAAILTGTDRARIDRLPDTTGMRSEIVVQRTHRNPYDRAVRQVGVRFVEIGHGFRTFDWELDAAIGPDTAAVVYVYGARTMHLPLSLTETVAIAHARGVPVVVDAAAEVPPARNLKGLKETGADVVVISGGKGLRGPQNSGLVLCDEALVEACILNAAPNHAIGRSMKATKEDIVGLVRAVEIYQGLDHDAETRRWAEDAALVVRELAGIAGVRAEVGEAGYSEGIPVARIDIDAAVLGRDAAAVAAALAAGDPDIRVGEARGGIVVNPHFLDEGEAALVAETLRHLLQETR